MQSPKKKPRWPRHAGIGSHLLCSNLSFGVPGSRTATADPSSTHGHRLREHVAGSLLLRHCSLLRWVLPPDGASRAQIPRARAGRPAGKSRTRIGRESGARRTAYRCVAIHATAYTSAAPDTAWITWSQLQSLGFWAPLSAERPWLCCVARNRAYCLWSGWMLNRWYRSG